MPRLSRDEMVSECQAWGEWQRLRMSQGLGYAKTNTLARVSMGRAPGGHGDPTRQAAQRLEALTDAPAARRARHLDWLIEQLPQEYRFVVRGRYVMGLGWRPIAGRLDCCQRTAQRYLDEALDGLAQALEDYPDANTDDIATTESGRGAGGYRLLDLRRANGAIV